MIRLSCDVRREKPIWQNGDALYHLFCKTTLLKTNSSYDDVLSFVEVELGKLQLELNVHARSSSLFYDTKMKSRPPDQNEDMINNKTNSISPITTMSTATVIIATVLTTTTQRTTTKTMAMTNITITTKTTKMIGTGSLSLGPLFGSMISQAFKRNISISHAVSMVYCSTSSMPLYI